MKLKIILALAAGWSMSATAEEGTRCYAIARPHPDVQESEEEVIQEDVESWCYRDLEGGGKYIFNGDSAVVQEELAMIVGTDGMIKYASRLQDEVTIHQVHQDEINPLNIPVQEPVAPSTPPSWSQSTSASEVYNILRSQPATDYRGSAIVAGEFSATSEKLPWHGFSWSFNEKVLFTGADAPLAKFDRYVFAHTNENPNSVAWEMEHHAGGAGWGGHCNGWASSTILRKEPVQPVVDEKSGITFKVSDLKGLLAVKDYCAKVNVYGNRNRETTTDRLDLSPALLHTALLYFIGQVKKPVAIDFRPDKVVDTHVISGYKMTIVDRGGGVFRVTAHLTLHRYLKPISEVTGPAPSYIRTYRYELMTGANGEITGSKWLSINPDFIYVPISPSNCRDRHPGVSEASILSILGN